MFKKNLLAGITLLVLQAYSASGVAEEPQPSMTREQFLASLHFQQGKIVLPNNIASLNLPDNFHYLPPDDAERVLVDAWGNPPGHASLGMIFPTASSPLDEGGWGIIITYDDDGHVNDDEARTINYDEILSDMQQQVADNNEQRKQDGYATMKLVGWAEQPRYDSGTHKFYWAKELAVEGSDTNTLNYNIRVLGREGVLVLNAIADMSQVSEIRQQMPTVVAATEFTTGNAYTDFDSSTDKVAEYGLAALLAGGVAAKMGFFGKIFAMLIVFKKFILLGLLAAGAFVTRLLGKKK